MQLLGEGVAADGLEGDWPQCDFIDDCAVAKMHLILPLVDPHNALLQVELTRVVVQHNLALSNLFSSLRNYDPCLNHNSALHTNNSHPWYILIPIHPFFFIGIEQAIELL